MVRRLPLILGLFTTAPALAQAPTLVPTDLNFSVLATALHAPTAAQFLPDGRMIILFQNGELRVRPAGGGALINAGHLTVFLGHSEQGLLNVAVDPQFVTTNRLYFFYSEDGSPQNDRHRIAYATIDPVTSRVDVNNLHVIARGLYGPQNHNGGGLAFGPDGNIYFSVGDDGCNCVCAPGRGINQYPNCLGNASGKIMRIDREGGIPSDNPLAIPGLMVPSCSTAVRPCASGSTVLPNRNVLVPPRPDVYVWGFRNPWRFSFDSETGYMWIGDVGEITWEEINVATTGGLHFGWPFREGAHGDPPSACPRATGLSTVASTLGDCVDPVYEYPHNGGAGSVTGGIFSNHCSWPEPWRGRYWFADYDMQYMKVSTLTPDPATGRRTIVPGSATDVLVNAGGVAHFFDGPDHAIYMVNIVEGEIWRIGPARSATCSVDAGVIQDATVSTSSDAGALDVGTSSASDAGADVGAGDDAPPNEDAEPPSERDIGLEEDALVADSRGMMDASAEDQGTAERKGGCGCGSAPQRVGGPWLGVALLYGVLSRWGRRSR